MCTIAVGVITPSRSNSTAAYRLQSTDSMNLRVLVWRAEVCRVHGEDMATKLLVGTRKGLWIGTSDDARDEWSFTGPHHDMEEIYSAMVEPGTGRILVGASSLWLGPLVRASEDEGQTWTETSVKFPDDVDASVSRVWQLAPGTPSDSDGATIWAGTEPGAIFRSTDAGASFELVRGLWDHPHRPEWNAGFGGQAFHTILPHPSDPSRVLAALSTGGVYRSDDGGASWQDIAPGLPTEFGFAMVAHPHRADTAYNFPITGAEARWPVDGKARVYRTTDAGSSWEPLGEGILPDGYYTAVMRDALCVDDHDQPGLYFGGRNGGVWASPDEGASWQEIHKDLPDVLVLRAARI